MLMVMSQNLNKKEMRSKKKKEKWKIVKYFQSTAWCDDHYAKEHTTKNCSKALQNRRNCVASISLHFLTYFEIFKSYMHQNILIK